MDTSRVRQRVAPLLIAAVALATTLAMTEAGSAGKGAAGKGKSQDQGRLAKRSVAAVIGAPSPGARQKALLKLMRALRIGVVSSAGKPLAGAGEANSARRFQLYDFELGALGGQLERGELVSLEDVAERLSTSGLKLAEDKALPAELLGEGLRDAVRSARKAPRGQKSLLPLVLRELGLRRGQDLARAPFSEVRLDALQAWLLSADMAISVLRKVPRSAGSAQPTARGAAVTDDCERFNKLSEKLDKEIERGAGGKVEAWVAKKGVGYVFDKVTDKLDREATRWGIRNAPRWAVRGLWKGRKALARVNPITEGLHGMLLAFSVKVSSLDQLLETHYGHKGKPGEQLVFRVKVESLDDYGELAAKCGKLAGVELPRRGPIEDVPIVWEQALAQLEPRHGTTSCAGATICTTKTGADGIASLSFTPKDETGPPIGIQKVDTGVMNGIALYHSGLGAGIPGLVAQFIAPKLDGTRWEVGYHDARGYRFSGTWYYENRWGDYHNGWIDLTTCAADPYSEVWRGTMRLQGDEAGVPPPFDETQPVETRLDPDKPTTLRVYSESMWLAKRMHLQLFPDGSPPHADIWVEYAGEGPRIKPRLEAATDCPA